MDILRNFINISGITDADDLPANFKGQILQYAAWDTVFLPHDRPGMKSIFQVMIEIEKKSMRSVKTPLGYSHVIDCFKRLKIIYIQNDDTGKATFWDVELPYNIFLELPCTVSLESINVHVIDAYFNLLDSRKIYSHLVLMVFTSLTSPSYSDIDFNLTLPEEPEFLEFDIPPVEPPLEREIPETKPQNNRQCDEKPAEEFSDVLIDVDSEYL